MITHPIIYFPCLCTVYKPKHTAFRFSLQKQWGDNIKVVLKERSLSQAWLSSELHIEENNLSATLGGKRPTSKTFYFDVIEILNCQPVEVFNIPDSLNCFPNPGGFIPNGQNVYSIRLSSSSKHKAV